MHVVAVRSFHRDGARVEPGTVLDVSDDEGRALVFGYGYAVLLTSDGTENAAIPGGVDIIATGTPDVFSRDPVRRRYR